MRRRPRSPTMMEGRDYADDDEGLFRFDTEEEEAAFMNNLNEDDLMEPLTPVGSAEPVIAPAILHHAAATAAAAASGRPHSSSHSNNFSSVNAWQQPEPASPPPPPLSYSPSPSATPATHHRPADRRRLSSHRSRQSRLSHQGSDQSLAQHSHRPAPVPAAAHHEDLQHQPPVQDQVDDDGLIDDDLGGQIQHQRAVNEDEPSRDELRENGFVEIDADGVEAMFNGNEADRITAQKFQSEVLKTIKQNGKVVYMVGQATAQWWLSSEMQKRRRAAARRMLDIGGAVASSAGNVIMNNTPIGGVVTTVSDNVTAFRAAPFLYTMQGLGIMKKNKPTTAVLSPTTANQHMSNDRLLGPDEDKHFAPSPAIVQDEIEDDMLGVLNFDDADDI
ncbi:hypothetical protein KVR01_000344 [Diaporthe batatas]|uniref:uncharacterized protein n=1 Tax=Diaporthe batatas TaxID=748121 RepID=UPI001D04A0F8|nr:uncharacterized protein KVR01_000344 [Diaporthe batatas]KAG8169599.1 hypothetical protein KVR01_000344 [Diaporthe batatas]